MSNTIETSQIPLTNFFKDYNLSKAPLDSDALAGIFAHNLSQGKSVDDIAMEIFNQLPDSKQTPQNFNDTKEFTAEAAVQLAQINTTSDVGVSTEGNKVIIQNGEVSEIRSEGTRAWRNNNPGNIRYGSFAKNHGAIGEAGGFAVFPDEETGFNALTDLLKTENYQKLTIQEAISRYAPPSENDTQNYQAYIEKETGYKSDVLLSSLDEAGIQNMAKAIRNIEGWRVGTIEQKELQ